MQKKLLVVFLMAALSGHAQTIRLDSLKKALTLLAGTGKINCLIAIAREYNYNFIRADSSLQYATIAYQLSVKEKNNICMALALLTEGDVKGRLLGDLVAMEKNCKQAIVLLKNEKDPVSLSKAYYKLSIAYVSGGKADAALDAAATARQISTIAGDKPGLGWAIEATGLIYAHHGEYWKSFENMIESQQIGQELHDSLMVATSLAFIGRSFNRVNDPQKALDYYHQAIRFATPFFLLWPCIEDMAYAHMQLKQYDSAIFYQQKHLHNLDSLAVEPMVRKKFGSYFWGLSSEVQLARKQYDEIISSIVPQLPQLRSRGDVFPWMGSLLILAKAYQGKEKTGLAIVYTREVLQLAARDANKQYLRAADQLMASLFDQLKQSDSAYVYFKKYTMIKDAIDSMQFSQRTALYLAASAATAKINLLQKDNTIAGQKLVLNKKELLRQSQLKNALGISLLALVVLFALLVRNIILKRKNDKLRHEQLQLSLQRKALELEMQALRAQMNPHFIFNCLSAIDNLIQTNQPDKATSYLSRFASLIRGVLDSSKNNLVPFQKDFETLKLYLEMEQFRCNNKFTYRLEADQQLLDGDYKVPPLIIQPFAENAIHHGLLNKPDANRQLQISARLLDRHIVYSVTDNGVGRKRSADLKQVNRPGHQSYGIAITKERIQLHNRAGVAGDVLITDLEQGGVATGTVATVKIDNLEW